MKRISIHLPEKDIKWLDKKSKKAGICRAEFLRRLINIVRFKKR